MSLLPQSLLAAAFRFEQLNGNSLSQSELNEISEHGLQGISAGDLSQALIIFIQNYNSHRSTAYWALGKAYDKSLIPFFIRQLSTELPKNSDCVYQIMIALGNLEERVFSEERSGSSIREYDLNISDAKAYLKKKTEQDAAANP